MTIGILGKKLGMTQYFQPDGTWVPVSVVQAGPCRVLQVKVKDVAELPEAQRRATTNLGRKRGKVERPRRSDGYYAVQLGFLDRRSAATSPGKDQRRKCLPTTKPEQGHAAKAGAVPQRFVRELRFDALPPYQQGDEVKVDSLKDVKFVDVTGTTKGRGFTGTIKRWNFHRQGMSHGNSKHHRKVGGLGRQYSISKGVPKGKRMCGHYGVERVTIQNLELMKIDPERNLLYIRGAVPGHNDGFVVVQKTVKAHRAKVVLAAKTKKKA
jgi:large subunit ribosomal protein L3